MARPITTTINGTSLVIYDLGIILIGKSAIGKSELALDLISRGHKFIADDMTEIIWEPSQDYNKLVIKPVKEDFYPMHLRSIGFIDIAKLFSASQLARSHELNLIIELKDDLDILKLDLLSPLKLETIILDQKVTQLQLPVNNRYSLTTIVEVMVKNFKIQLSSGVENAINFN